MSQWSRILVVEDNAGDSRLIREYLRLPDGTATEIDVALTLREAALYLAGAEYDAALLDLGLPDSQGLPTFRSFVERAPGLPVVILSGLDDTEVASEAVRFGAQDYLVKGTFDGESLLRSINYAVDRKRFEAVLREERDLVRTILDTAQTIILLLDGDGRIVDYNRYMADLTGYPIDEVRGKDWFATFLVEEDRDRVQELFRTAREGHPTMGNTDRLVTRAGEIRWIEWFDKVLWDERGEFSALVSIGHDVTDRLEAERAIRRSNRALRTLSESNQRLVRATDEAQLLDWISESIVIHGEYESACVYLADGKDCRPASCVTAAEDPTCTPEDAVVFDEVRRSIAEGRVTTIDPAADCGGQPGRAGIVVPLRSELEIIGALSVRAVDDDSLSPEQVGLLEELSDDLAFGIGVLRQRKAHEKATTRIRFQANLLDRVGQAVIATNPDGRIIYWNSGAEALYGWASGEVLGRRIARVTPPAMSRGEVEQLMNRLHRGEPWSGELILQRKDGSTFVGIVHDSPICDEEGNLAAVIGVTTDVSALKVAEARLARSLDQTIRAVASITELRDPYTAGHQRRVAELARAIAEGLGWSGESAHDVWTAALLHDVGKLAVPAEILSKPTRLSETEMEIIKVHPNVAFDLLASIDLPERIPQAIRQHHERIDGSGYPNGLQGDVIEPSARVLAVADVVEAMSSHRPYRPALGEAAALAEIRGGRGSRYDEAVVDTCADLLETGRFAWPEI